MSNNTKLAIKLGLDGAYLPAFSKTMKKEYDFATMKGRKNPFATKLKKQVTIRMSEDVIGYFKALADDTGIPYQTLINLYLRDCVAHKRKPELAWLRSKG